jgi:DNA-binding MurR/RpiR family transcriptional regulator
LGIGDANVVMSQSNTFPSSDHGARHSGVGFEDVTSALAANYERLSPGQRLVIDRLLTDTRYAVVVSAAKLAEEVGVSESTVTRAAQTLGFAGYPDLQTRLRERFFIAVPDRIEASAAELGDTPETAAIRVMLEDSESVRLTAEDLSPAALRATVETLLAARRVYVFGSRGSQGLTLMLGIGLRLLLPDVRVLSQAIGDLPDQLITLDADDALIAISFRRVDRVTVNVLRHASKVEAKTIAITDSLSSPVARMAGVTLLARLGRLRLMPSYAAGASLVNALTLATSLRTLDSAATRLQVAEQLWQSFDTHADD